MMKEYSLRTFAKIFGIGIILMAIIAGFAYGFAFQKISNSIQQSPNPVLLTHHQMLCRWMVFSFILIILLDIIVAWAGYYLFRPTQASLSQLTAWTRLIYSAMLAIALSGVVSLIPYLSDNETTQKEIQTGFKYFLNYWSVGLWFFSIHLFLLGILSWKSGKIPKLFAILLFIASIGYLVDNTLHILDPNYLNYANQLTKILAIPMAIGELAIAFWLLYGTRKKSFLSFLDENTFSNSAK